MRDFLLEVQPGTACSFDQELVGVRLADETDETDQPAKPAAAGTSGGLGGGRPTLGRGGLGSLLEEEVEEEAAKPPMELYRLGRLHQRLVVTPDVGSLLERCAAERAAQAKP